MKNSIKIRKQPCQLRKEIESFVNLVKMNRSVVLVEDISEVITRIIKKRKLSEDGKKIAKTAIKHPSVQAFLAQNKDKLNKEIVQASLPTIF